MRSVNGGFACATQAASMSFHRRSLTLRSSPAISCRRRQKRVSMSSPSTSVAEVTNVSRHGFWLLLGQEELFVPFSDFSWFASAPIGDVVNVEWPSPEHLYWPVVTDVTQ